MISSSALCQFVKWADSGGSSASAETLRGKQLLKGISRWKPVPTPSISAGNNAWSGSCMIWQSPCIMCKHIGWWSRIVQSGLMPESCKNCSRSLRKGVMIFSANGGEEWSVCEKNWTKNLSNRLSKMRWTHFCRRGPKKSVATRSPKLQSGLDVNPPPSSCPKGGWRIVFKGGIWEISSHFQSCDEWLTRGATRSAKAVARSSG